MTQNADSVGRYDEESEWTVVVPMRTYQTFTVRADSAAKAKSQVERWLQGVPSEAEPMDDLGQQVTWPRKRQWLVHRYWAASPNASSGTPC